MQHDLLGASVELFNDSGGTSEWWAFYDPVSDYCSRFM